jgi:hypothetical protein
MPCAVDRQPSNIIMFTCDAFGVLPPVSKHACASELPFLGRLYLVSSLYLYFFNFNCCTRKPLEPRMVFLNPFRLSQHATAHLSSFFMYNTAAARFHCWMTDYASFSDRTLCGGVFGANGQTQRSLLAHQHWMDGWQVWRW